VQVEIYSDVGLPWCAVGKRRLELALGQFEHADEIDVIWRAYELDPDAPPLREGDLCRAAGPEVRDVPGAGGGGQRADDGDGGGRGARLPFRGGATG